MDGGVEPLRGGRCALEEKGELQIFVDAGFRESSAHPVEGRPGKAGLGVWIPALGTGVALPAVAKDNNEAETLAMLLGVVVGNLMALSRTLVLTDSRFCFENLSRGEGLAGALLALRQALHLGHVALEWRSREHLVVADFFASLALEGKSLIATSPNGRSPMDRFRPLLHATRGDKRPIKDVRVKWLSSPHPPKTLPELASVELARIAPGGEKLLGERFPCSDLGFLIMHFRERSRG